MPPIIIIETNAVQPMVINCNAHAIIIPTTVKVIPNTGNSASAPAKRKIKSLEDIEAAYKEYTS